jgi:hypothetical protein
VDRGKDRKKVLSIWNISGQQLYESLGMPDLPVKALSITPDAMTLCFALDACRTSHFKKEAYNVWNYGKENDRIVLDSNVLTSYVIGFLKNKGFKKQVARLCPSK